MSKKSIKSGDKNHSDSHPDHASSLNRIRRIKGQVEGLERMLLERRYCPDILVQVRAANAALRVFATEVLERHLHHCVQDAFESKDRSQAEKKVRELLELFKKGP